MPLSFRQAGNTFIAGPNIAIYPSGNTFAISGSASGSTVGVESISTIGNGLFSIASSVTNNNLVYKSITGTSNLSINDDENGTLIFSLTSGIGTIISGTNVGTGVDFFTGLTTTTNPNDTLAFRNLLAGPNISISPSVDNDGDITITRGVNVVNQISNVGGGARILLTGLSTNVLSGRTFNNNNGISVQVPGTTGIIRIIPTNTTLSKAFIFDNSNTLNTAVAYHAGTTGGLGIGQVTTTTSRLLPGQGSATQSNIRFTAFAAAYTGATDGDIWYTSSNDLKFNKGVGATTDFIFKDNNNSLTGLSQSLLSTNSAGTILTEYINTFGVFNTLSSITISNTTSETSTISSQITGSTTLLASNNIFNPQLVTGRKYRFNARGTISVQNVDTTLNIRIKLGSTIISSSSTISFFGSINPYDGDIEIDSTFTVRSSGLIVGSGKVVFPTQPPSTIGGDPIIFGIYSQNQTITTTSNQVFDCTAQFDIADSGSSIIINESTLEFLN